MANFFGGVERVRDRDGVVAFFPAVRGHIAAARSVRARIHHHDALTVAEQKFRMSQIAGAIVRDAVKKQHPIAIRGCWNHFPAAKLDSVIRVHAEIQL